MNWIDDGEAGIRYNDLHNRYTNDIKHLTYKFRGFYLKSAQLMSAPVQVITYEQFL
jgi:hypothetical protein